MINSHFYLFRPSKYLKMPYKLLHHTLCLKLNYKFIRSKERFFVLSRLRLFDELCYMDTLLQVWQDYYEIGDKHQLWPVSWQILLNIKSTTFIFIGSYYENATNN